MDGYHQTPNNKSRRGSPEQSTVTSNISRSPQEKEHKSKNEGFEEGGENLINLRSNTRVYKNLSLDLSNSQHKVDLSLEHNT